MQRKRTIIQPVKPDGLLGPQILTEKSILEQLIEALYSFTIHTLAVFGLVFLTYLGDRKSVV